MSMYDWEDLLTRWSSEILHSQRHVDMLRKLGSMNPHLYGPEVFQTGWLGFPGANPDQIAAAEARLGVALPPDYRDFLELTNGWRWTGTFIPRVLPIEEVRWLRETDPDLIAAWVDIPSPGGHGPVDLYESRYIASTLQVSEPETGGTAVYLLNPRVVSPNGEWEAWFMAHWVPGSERYPSFWELMNAEHRSFLNLNERGL
jgi:hypothetical protein